MIGIQGQWFLTLGIDGTEYADVIERPEDLISFKIIEVAQNTIPMFELVFRTDNWDVINNCQHEGIVIKATLGREIHQAIEMPLRPFKIFSTEDAAVGGRHSCVIAMVGVYDALPYLGHACETYPDARTSTIVPFVASKFWKFQTNVAETDDQQLWIQSNVSYKQFLSHLCAHSYVADNCFQTLGITASGKLRFLNIPKVAKEEPRWRFTPYDIQTEKTTDGSRAGSGGHASADKIDAQVEELVAGMETGKDSAVAEQSETLAGLQSEMTSAKSSVDAANIKDGAILRAIKAVSERSNVQCTDTVEDTFRPYVDGGLVTPSQMQSMTSKAAKLQAMRVQSADAINASENLADTIAEGLMMDSQRPSADIIYHDFGVVSHSGFVNTWIGHERTTPYHNLETQEDLEAVARAEAHLASLINRSQSSSELTRAFSKTIRTRNHHDHFFEAQMMNLTKQALFSNQIAEITIADQFHGLEVLDLVNIIVRDVAHEGREDMMGQSAHSGLYLISKIIRQIVNNKLVTVISLAREGINSLNPKGKLK